MREPSDMDRTAGEILAQGTLVKSNPVRKVLRHGDFYLKLDVRPGSSFAKEFRGAQLLARAGIPVAEHLAYGRVPEGSYLITRAWGDGTSVQDHVEKNGAGEAFLKDFAAFLNGFYRSGLWHGDLHWGNVLYDAGSRKFAFVDVRAVRRAPFRRLLFGKRLRRIALNLRAYLSRSRLLEFLRDVGIPRPEPWLRRALRAEIRRIRREWPRRRKQILSGYPKFTVPEAGKLRSVPVVSAETDAGAEQISGPEAEAVFLAHFYLQLMAIPHRRALWFDPGSRTVALEAITPAPEVPLTEEEFSDWQDRLRQIGGESAVSDWEAGRNTVLYRGTAGFARRFSATGGLIC